MIKKYNEMFENEKNLWDINKYKTKYEIDLIKEIGIFLEDFKAWCDDNNIIVTEEMIKTVIDESYDKVFDCVKYFNIDKVYKTDDDFTFYYKNIIKEYYPEIYTIKDFNI